MFPPRITEKMFPSEIIEKIMDDLVFVPGERDVAEHSRRCLRRVCYRWWKIVDTKSSYWNCITIAPWSRPSYVRFCVDKTGSRPFRLSIDSRLVSWTVGGRHLTHSFSDLLHTLSTSVKPAFNRVTELNVTCAAQGEWDVLLNELGTWLASSLQSVSAQIDSYYPEPSAVGISAFESAPMLSRVVLKAIAMGGGPGLFLNLRYLCIDSLTAGHFVEWADLRAALATAARLEQLDLHYVACAPSTAVDVAISMDALTYLGISARDEAGVEIASLVVAPALTKLRIDLCAGASVGEFGRLFRHSTGLPATVELLLDASDVDEAVELLREMVAAESLDLRECDRGVLRAVFQELRSNRNFLPRLHTLEVDVEFDGQEADDAMAALDSRNLLASSGIVSVAGRLCCLHRTLV